MSEVRKAYEQTSIRSKKTWNAFAREFPTLTTHTTRSQRITSTFSAWNPCMWSPTCLAAVLTSPFTGSGFTS